MQRTRCNVRQVWLVVVAAVAVGSGSLARASASTKEERSAEAFVKWARDTAIPVERWKMNPKLDAWLERAVAGKRIVFIGEPGHFFNEKYEVQLLLIEHLAKRGYRHLFIEGLGATMATIVDEFVRTGVRAPNVKPEVDRRGHYRHRVQGGLARDDASEFHRRHQAAQRRFFDALHKLSASLPENLGPLTIHPLDVDMIAGGCMFSVADLLNSYEDGTPLADLKRRCARVPDEPIANWLARVEDVRAIIKRNADGVLNPMKPTERSLLRQYVDCLVESLAFVVTRQADGKLDRALVRREPAMYRQVKFALDRLPPNAKVIMMAQNNHLSRIGADTTRARQPSVGEMIEAAHPGKVFSLWMLHDHGWLLNPMAKKPLVQLRSDPQRVESLMRRAGATYVLPLHTGADGERYLDVKRRISYFTWFETATLTRQTDAIFFIDEITPL